jgi:hypothetical protein
MPVQPSIPLVHAVLNRGKHSWIWVVPRCPYCGDPHAHYGGPFDTDPATYLASPMTAVCQRRARYPSGPPAPAGTFQYVLQVAGPA